MAPAEIHSMSGNCFDFVWIHTGSLQCYSFIISEEGKQQTALY